VLKICPQTLEENFGGSALKILLPLYCAVTSAIGNNDTILQYVTSLKYCHYRSDHEPAMKKEFVVKEVCLFVDASQRKI